MKYTIKWVTEHMGITRDMIREYEKQGLIDKKTFQNPNNKYREYDEEDLRTLWTIKLLIEIGFKIKQIKSFVDDDTEQNFGKILNELLESKKTELNLLEKKIQLIEYILMTGLTPSIKEVGNITIKDFINIVYNSFEIPYETHFFEFWDFLKHEVKSNNFELSDETFILLEKLVNDALFNKYCLTNYVLTSK